MNEIKVGDQVRVTKVMGADTDAGILIDSIFEVLDIAPSGFGVFGKNERKFHYYLSGSQIKKVETGVQTEMTFPEMAQKLIDGEFEVDTELVMTDEDEDKSTFYVTKNNYGYGVNKLKEDVIPTFLANPSHINGIWTTKETPIKEQPVKEMSIEQLQKELGYKIKIVGNGGN